MPTEYLLSWLYIHFLTYPGSKDIGFILESTFFQKDVVDQVAFHKMLLAFITTTQFMPLI